MKKETRQVQVKSTTCYNSREEKNISQIIKLYFSRYEQKSDVKVKATKEIDMTQKAAFFDELRDTLCVNIRIGI